MSDRGDRHDQAYISHHECDLSKRGVRLLGLCRINLSIICERRRYVAADVIYATLLPKLHTLALYRAKSTFKFD
jgi:hypothetical protein